MRECNGIFNDMADYEIKLALKKDLSIEDKSFIEKIIDNLCKELDMEIQDDSITYSKKPPYKKLEDIPAGFKFYNKLRKYKEYFSIFEYYSYLEGDYNGRIDRSNVKF